VPVRPSPGPTTRSDATVPYCAPPPIVSATPDATCRCRPLSGAPDRYLPPPERAAYLTAGASAFSLNEGSQTAPPLRLPDMTLYLRRRSAYPAGLTASQLTALARVWEMAGLMPMGGYERVFLVAAVSSSSGLVETLSSVDLDDSESAANAVSDLLQWRQRVMD
jgi:hypothetical protein